MYLIMKSNHFPLKSEITLRLNFYYFMCNILRWMLANTIRQRKIQYITDNITHKKGIIIKDTLKNGSLEESNTQTY